VIEIIVAYASMIALAYLASVLLPSSRPTAPAGFAADRPA
jgi:hypothetical protein